MINSKYYNNGLGKTFSQKVIKAFKKLKQDLTNAEIAVGGGWIKQEPNYDKN